MSKFILAKINTTYGKLYFHSVEYNRNPNRSITPRCIVWTSFPKQAANYDTPRIAMQAAKDFKIDKRVVVEPAFLPKMEGAFACAK